LYPGSDDLDYWKTQYKKFINIKITEVDNNSRKSVLCGLLILNFHTPVTGKDLFTNPNMPIHTKKYYIKINIDDLFYQINNRTLKYIYNNRKKYRKI
jgi:hypothetical protein